MMKLTIDTKEDSPDEIRKAIRMLSSCIGDSAERPGHHKDVFSDDSKESGSGGAFLNMFGDSAPPEKKEEKDDMEVRKVEEDKPPKFKDDEIHIVPYE